MDLGASIASGVWAWVHMMSGSHTVFRRRPVQMRSIWRTAFVPSLPAHTGAAYGRPAIHSSAA